MKKKTHFEKERLVGITGFLRKTDPRKKKKHAHTDVLTCTHKHTYKTIPRSYLADA